MLILQIALGIVLAWLILRFWEVALALVLFVIVAGALLFLVLLIAEKRFGGDIWGVVLLIPFLVGMIWLRIRAEIWDEEQKERARREGRTPESFPTFARMGKGLGALYARLLGLSTKAK